MKLSRFALLACAVAFALPASAQKKPGYTDTPKLPNSKWRVHDADRPEPRTVKPGTESSQAEAGKPPEDAVVLFDGKDISEWRGRKETAEWKVEGGAMIVNGTGDIRSKDEFGSCQLHVEWMAPAEKKGKGQGRGNSGVFFFGRYEVQVLDSYENRTYSDGQAASLYGQKPPDVNACRPAGQWQSYDIVFTAPKFDDKGKLVSPAYVTVFHNGVLVQYHQKLLGPTAHRSLPQYKPHGAKGPIKLQDHGNPVRYRNIWVRELD